MMPSDLPPEAHAYQKAWQKNQRSLIKKGADRAYLYVHLEADSGEPFYIGMGETEGRPWSRSRSNKHKNRANKHGMRVDVDDTPGMSWEIAGWWETRWIKAFRDAGYDLANIADGGDGLSSRAATEINARPEVRAKQKVTQKKRWSEKTETDRVLHGKKTREGQQKADASKTENEKLAEKIRRGEAISRALNESDIVAKKRKITLESWEKLSDEERADRGKKVSDGKKAARKLRGLPEKPEKPKKSMEQIWSEKTDEELAAHGRKVSEGIARSRSKLDEKTLAEIKELKKKTQRIAQNRPETVIKRSKSSTNRWANMPDSERKDMGRRMSEGKRRAREEREAAANLSELKDL